MSAWDWLAVFGLLAADIAFILLLMHLDDMGTRDAGRVSEGWRRRVRREEEP